MVQLIIAHPILLTCFNLQEYLFNNFPMTHTHTHTHTHRVIVSSLMGFRLTSTRPCPTQARASNLHNLLIYNTFLQVPFFFNHSPLSLTSQLTTHKRYHYSNADITFETNPYPQQYHLQVHSPTSLR